MLASEHDALADPISYVMWCDLFESARVEEAWRALITSEIDERLFERVLIASGPVPFPLKAELYTRLIGQQRWHYFIFRSLLHSAYDYFGNVEPTQALAVLERLKLDLTGDDHEAFSKLVDALENNTYNDWKK